MTALGQTPKARLRTPVQRRCRPGGSEGERSDERQLRLTYPRIFDPPVLHSEVIAEQAYSRPEHKSRNGAARGVLGVRLATRPLLGEACVDHDHEDHLDEERGEEGDPDGH
jgi:hypothetical protein